MEGGENVDEGQVLCSSFLVLKLFEENKRGAGSRFGDDAAQSAAVWYGDDFESELDGEIELRAEAGVQR
jgi:hypothetical protein